MIADASQDAQTVSTRGGSAFDLTAETVHAPVHDTVAPNTTIQIALHLAGSTIVDIIERRGLVDDLSDFKSVRRGFRKKVIVDQ